MMNQDLEEHQQRLAARLEEERKRVLDKAEEELRAKLTMVFSSFLNAVSPETEISAPAGPKKTS